MITAKTIQSYLDNYDNSNIEPIHNSTRKADLIFSINTEWLNEVHDCISVYLVKKDAESPWLLTDDGSTYFESKVSGLYDKHDTALKAYQTLSKNVRSYFVNTPIKFDPTDDSYYLTFKHLKDLDDNLHLFLQVVIEHINSAVLVTTFRELQSKHNHKSQERKPK